MDNSKDDEATRLLVERYIDEVEERRRALRAVIEQMEASGGDTTNQMELLTNMTTALEALVDFKARM